MIALYFTSSNVLAELQRLQVTCAPEALAISPSIALRSSFISLLVEWNRPSLSISRIQNPDGRCPAPTILSPRPQFGAATPSTPSPTIHHGLQCCDRWASSSCPRTASATAFCTIPRVRKLLCAKFELHLPTFDSSTEPSASSKPPPPPGRPRTPKGRLCLCSSLL